MKVNLFDLLDIYESEVKKNVRNKKKILDFEKHKMEYLVDIKKGIKRANYLYKNNSIKFNQYFSSIECFKNNYIFVNKDKVNTLLIDIMGNS